MFRRIVSALVIHAAFVLPRLLPAQHAASKTTSQVAREATPATVTIIALSTQGDTLGQGSGFLVKSSGVIVTNWHVVRGAAKAIVVLASGERFERVQALDGDEAADLAVLKIPGFGLPTLTPTATLPAAGERVVVIGSPLGLSRTVSEGIVSAVRLDEGRQVLQVTAPISPGSSGGPVLDREGRVVAVSTWFLSKGQQLNFAVPVKYAVGMIDGAGAPRPLPALFGAPQAAGTQSASDTTTSANPVRVEGSGSAGMSHPAAPARAAAVRPSLEGVYEFTEHSIVYPKDAAPHPYQAIGVAVLIEDGDGFLVYAPADKPTDSAQVLWVESVLTARDGRAAAHVMGIDADGYQTDRGFYLTGRYVGERLSFDAALDFSHFVPNLSSQYGLYDVQVRTQFTASTGAFAGTTDWSGSMGAVVVRDSIWIDLSLKNSAGGTTGMVAAGVIKDGMFTVESSSHTKTLSGRVSGGRLFADWIDRRENGSAYKGRLTADRR